MIEFGPVVDDFTDTMDALREFVVSLLPVLLQREKDLAESAWPLFARFATAMLISEEKGWDNVSEEQKSQVLELRNRIVQLASVPQSGSSFADAIKKAIPITFIDGKPKVDWNAPEAAELMPTGRAISGVKKQLRLLHDSALMALTSRSEWFIAQLLHLYFNKHPSAAGLSAPFFSFETLASLQTIDDAKEVLLDHKVEAMMRESLEDWLKFFKDRPKLGMAYLSKDIGRMAEIFKRRNLVVHNGGRASRRYFVEVDEALRPGIKLGDVIEVSDTYLYESIDLLEHQFLLLALELWKTLEPSDETRGRFITNTAVRCLDKKRWLTARGLSQFGINDKNLSEVLRLSSQINYWQSFKWAGRYEEIREEVGTTDFSAKAPLFRLAHAVMVDDFELCFKMIPDLLAHDELKKIDLNRWPLFQALWERPEFSIYKMTNEGKEPNKNSDDGAAQGVIN